MPDYHRRDVLKLNQQTEIIEALNGSLVEEINIYHQAYISLERPIIVSKNIHQITKYERSVYFNIRGDIEGNVICLLDMYNKTVHDRDKALFHSLYIESMNILLGKILTNLENYYYYTAMLDSPQIIENNRLDHIISDDFFSIKLCAGYTLTFNQQEFDCRLIINLKK